jgi:prephenate dehydrogenase
VLPGGVLIIGAGLIGASLGLALRRAGVDVRLRDSDSGALDEAVAFGAGRRSAPTDARADLAVVAVPPVTVGAVAVGLLDDDAAEYVTDVASVKALPASYVRVHSSMPGRYVGSHPMAGRELSGPSAALVDLFEGRPWVLCPDDRTDHQAVARVLTLARLVGANPVTMPAAEHDAAVALVSHAPHLMAALMAGRLSGAPPHEVRLAGAGVNDVTRVAAGDPSLWSEILTANAVAVHGVLAGIRDDLDTVLSSLENDVDKGALGEILRSGVTGRARLPGKHGAPHIEFATVFVVVDDRPGQLARLFADADAAGVNVEDVRIEHIPGQPEGVVELDVRHGSDEGLAKALRAHGWTVR